MCLLHAIMFYYILMQVVLATRDQISPTSKSSGLHSFDAAKVQVRGGMKDRSIMEAVWIDGWETIFKEGCVI